MELTIAYLAQGRLYIKPEDGAAKEISSQFVERAADRARKAAERNAWKAGNGAAGPDMIPSAMLWRSQMPNEQAQRVQILGVTRGSAGAIMFALDTQSIGGLFAYDPADGSERRLFHKNGFRGRHLAKHASRDLVALSVAGGDNTSHIALTDTAGHAVREITEGDSRDECPSWAPGDGQKLVFQSAGIARNAQGFLAAPGPYRIEQLDIDRGEMTTLMESDTSDYLSPRVGADGSLYFIRRPYSPHARPVSLGHLLLDIVLFPIRLVRAFVHFFNFFSLAFSGKPLMTAGGSREKGPDAATLMLWGKMIDAEKALKTSKDGKSASLVPTTWQLVRQDHSRQESVLAKAVLSFDLASDGSVIYTDGSTITRLKPDGQLEVLCNGTLIEQVNFLPQ